MKKYTLLLFLFAFYISSLPVYGALPSCNVKVVASSTVSIDALPKTCTVEKLKGVTPYELGGVSPLYLISGKGNVYRSMGGDTTYQCLAGGWTWDKAILNKKDSYRYDPLADYIGSFKTKNYLTYYSDVGYSWMMVRAVKKLPSSGEERKGVDASYRKQKSPHFSEYYGDTALFTEAKKYGYREGYYRALDEFPVFVVGNIVYNPWTKPLGSKFQNYAQALVYEVQRNTRRPGSAPHKTYYGPRGFLGKDTNGKMIVARQESIMLEYDSEGKPIGHDGGYYHVSYNVRKCTIQ